MKAKIKPDYVHLTRCPAEDVLIGDRVTYQHKTIDVIKVEPCRTEYANVHLNDWCMPRVAVVDLSS